MEEPRGLLDVTRQKMRTRHMAYRTGQAYLRWIRLYVVCHKRRHPLNLGAADLGQFLTDLDVERKVSAATQSRAEVKTIMSRLGRNTLS